MSNDQPYLPRAGADERVIVGEMIRDQHAEHWAECRKFVKLCVEMKAKNIPDSHHEDIIQEVMHKITKSLPDFRFESTLKTWVNIIVQHSTIDVRRRLRNEERSHISLTVQVSESDYEGEGAGVREEQSAEETFMANDELRNAWRALLEYAQTHSNPIRDQHIIWMVIHEGQSYAEAAVATGCSVPVVGYVVRQAQRYAREKMGYRLRYFHA